jgi:hypothetical protein
MNASTLVQKLWNYCNVLRAKMDVALPKYLNLALSYYPYAHDWINRAPQADECCAHGRTDRPAGLGAAA